MTPARTLSGEIVGSLAAVVLANPGVEVKSSQPSVSRVPGIGGSWTANNGTQPRRDRRDALFASVVLLVLVAMVALMAPFGLAGRIASAEPEAGALPDSFPGVDPRAPEASPDGSPASVGQCARENYGHRFLGAGWLDFSAISGDVSGVDLADLNRDGIPDAVVSVRADAPGSGPPRLQTYLATEPMCFELKHERPVPQVGRVFLEDATGDGILDAIIFQSGSLGAYAVLEGSGDGTFLDLASYDFGGYLEWPAQVLVIDLDGDGHKDIIAVADIRFVAYGPDFRRPAYLVSGTERANGLVTFDADGDKRLDVLVSRNDWQSRFVLLLQKSPRAFESHAILGGGIGPLYAVGTDGEGRTQVFARTDKGFSTFAVVRREDAWESVETPLTVEARPLSTHVLGDLDGDGPEEIVAVFQDGLMEVRFREESAGGQKPGGAEGLGVAGGGGPLAWGDIAVTLAPTFDSWRPTALRDVNGDGLCDILFGRATILLGRSPLGDRVGLVAGRIVGEPLSGEKGAAIDLNGDQYADLIRVISDEVRVYLGGPEGLVEASRQSLAETVYSFAVGKPDPGGSPVLAFGTLGGVQASEISPEGLLWPPYVLSSGFAREIEFVNWGKGTGTAEEGDRLLIFREHTSPVIASCSLLEPRAGGSLVEAGCFFLPWPAGDATAVDLDLDGDRDLVFSTQRGAAIIRGSTAGPSGGGGAGAAAGGFEPYLGTVLLPWDSVDTLATLDLEGDGVWEIVAGRTSSGGALLIRSGVGGDWSAEKTLFAQISSGEINFLQAADADGDGRTDVVADARYCAEIFLNDGRGGLRRPPAVVPGKGAYSTEAYLVVLDLDGDGRLDLVRNGTVTFGVEGRSASGPIGGSVQLAELGGSTSGVAFGDFNGDGLVDLVAAHRPGPAEIYLGQARDVFGSKLPVGGSESGTYRIELGDFDGDGKLDIAAQLVAVAGTSWFRGKGDGTFELPAKLPGSAEIIVCAKDVAGDGSTELVVHSSSDGVLLHRGGVTFGAEAPLVLAPAIRSGASAGVADLNGDGHGDLVVRGQDSASRRVQLVFPGRPDGSLGDPVALAEPDFPFPDTLLADLDGDGFADSVRVDGKTLYLVKGRGDFTFSIVPLGELAEGFTPNGFRDVDGDGLLDILGFDSNWVGCIARARPGGTYEDPVFFSPMTTDFPLDANGDGLLDMVVVRYVTSYLSTVHAIFASRQYLLEGSRAFPFLLGRATAGDLEPGGGTELVLYDSRAWSVYVVVGDASRRLAIARTIAAPGGLSSDAFVFHAIGDYDNDGWEDLLLLADGTVYGYRNRGGLEFAEPVALVEDMPGYGIAVADLDKDGLSEILVSGFSVARGVGGGAFGAPRSYGALRPSGPPALLGDFDGDGIRDVVDVLGGGVLLLAAGDAQGGFRAMERLSPGSLEATAVTVGDFNADGLSDVAVGAYVAVDRGEKETSSVWYGRPGGAFERGQSLHDPVLKDDGASALVSADLNRDGADDVVCFDPWGYALTYFGGPEGLREAANATAAPGGPFYVFAANFAGDAAADLLVAGKVGVLLTLGEETIGPTRAAFVRGDSNADGMTNVADPVFIFRWLFASGPAAPCIDAADANDDGSIDVEDALQILGYLFLGTPVLLPGPLDRCGQDPTGDDLGCEGFPPCAGAGGYRVELGTNP